MSLTRVGFCLAVVAVCAAPVFAQPGGDRGRGGFGRGGGMTGLLMNEDVRTELEITDDQLADLRSMGEEARDQMRSMFEGMRDMSQEERRERMESMREEMQKFRTDMESRVGEVLLPHQVDRLKQINVQQQMRGGMQRGLPPALAEQLGISEEQQAEMAEKAEKIQEDMQEKIAKLREEAREELMSVLTPEQRSKLKEMMGETFEMENRGFGDRGRGGQRGGRPERGGE